MVLCTWRQWSQFCLCEDSALCLRLERAGKVWRIFELHLVEEYGMFWVDCDMFFFLYWTFPLSRYVICSSSFLRAHQHAGGTSTQPLSLAQRCLCLGAGRTALVPSTPTMRSTATRSRCLTRRPTVGWPPHQHRFHQKDAGVIQPVRDKYNINSIDRIADLSEFCLIVFVV